MLTYVEIDDAFRSAFLYALHDAKGKNREGPNHGIPFPVPQSLVVSNMVLPYLPIFNDADAATYQIKKTSWKNVKKFIKALDKQNLIKSKDRNGGETVILDADFEDRAVLEFVPYRLPKKAKAPEASEAQTLDISAKDSSVGQKLKGIQLYQPRSNLLPLFAPANANTRASYMPVEIQSVLDTYLKSENIFSVGPKSRMIQVNLFLANAVFGSESKIDQSVLQNGQASYEALLARVLDSCSKHYVIIRNDETREDHKLGTGVLPKIKVTLETRSGNKTATKISGVEAFRIQPTQLADELKRTCSSSTSVIPLQGASPKNMVMEIMVQGPQKSAVMTALERRGVRKDWVEFLDKTKAAKKRAG